MKNLKIAAKLTFQVLLAACCPSVLHAEPSASDRPPQVSILWPRPGDFFSVSTLIKIKADASQSDGSIAQVEFFAEANLIGVVTNPPFNILWSFGDGLHKDASGSWQLQA